MEETLNNANLYSDDFYLLCFWMVESIGTEMCDRYVAFVEDKNDSTCGACFYKLIQLWKSLFKNLPESTNNKIKHWILLCHLIVNTLEEDVVTLKLTEEVKQQGNALRVSKNITENVVKLLNTLIAVHYYNVHNIRKGRNFIAQREVLYKEELTNLFQTPNSTMPDSLQRHRLCEILVPYITEVRKKLGVPVPYKIISMINAKNISEENKEKSKSVVDKTSQTESNNISNDEVHSDSQKTTTEESEVIPISRTKAQDKTKDITNTSIEVEKASVDVANNKQSITETQKELNSQTSGLHSEKEIDNEITETDNQKQMNREESPLGLKEVKNTIKAKQKIKTSNKIEKPYLGDTEKELTNGNVSQIKSICASSTENKGASPIKNKENIPITKITKNERTKKWVESSGENSIETLEKNDTTATGFKVTLDCNSDSSICEIKRKTPRKTIQQLKKQKKKVSKLRIDDSETESETESDSESSESTIPEKIVKKYFKSPARTYAKEYRRNITPSKKDVASPRSRLGCNIIEIARDEDKVRSGPSKTDPSIDKLKRKKSPEVTSTTPETSKRKRVTGNRVSDDGESVHWTTDEEAPSEISRTTTATSRAKIPFSRDEQDNMIAGVNKFGVGNWAKILKRFKFHPSRTSVSLKDKYRTMKKQGFF